MIIWKVDEYVDVTYDTFKWIRKTPKAAATKVKCGYKICRFIQPLIKIRQFYHLF